MKGEKRMKPNTLMGKGLRGAMYAVLALPLFNISPSALSSDRPNWAQHYIGELRFDLSDDSRLKELNHNTRFARERLDEVLKALDNKTEDLGKLRNELKVTSAEIDKLSRETVAAVAEKNKIETQVKELIGKREDLNNKVKLAKVAKESQDAKVTELEERLAKVSENLQSTKTECATAPSAECEKKVENLTNRVSNITKNLGEAKELQKAAIEALKEAQKGAKNLEDKIAEMGARQTQIDQENSARATKVEQNQKKVATLQNRIDLTSNEARSLEVEKRKREGDFARTSNERDRYREKLIERVLEINHLGARYGVVDGNNDGLELAQRMGMNEGDRDGSTDGHRDGMRDGMTRAYNIGYNQGDIDGAARAKTEGEVNGTREGTIQGNIDAAEIEGAAAGEARANSSDAASVGSVAGAKDGEARADRQGKIDGEAKGQSEAIKKHESSELSTKEVAGEFAGAFSRVVPSFPRDARGRSFRDTTNQYKREIVALAYSDGYRAEYRRSIRMEFERNIARIYNDSYDAGYNFRYEDAFNRPYESERDRGYNDGESNAFARDYSGIFNQFFAAFRTQFSSSPNRDSNEFQSTFTQVEGNTYQRVYEDIRQAAYTQSETSTYAAEIEGKTEQYRQARFAAVDKLYKENAIVKFISSTEVDGGTNGVAAVDGVIMPGEDLIYNVTVKNFGDTPAKNVTVALSNGKSFKVDSIPAKSQTTVKGAAKIQAANARIGATEKVELFVSSALQTGDAVEARHFSHPRQSIAGTDTHTHRLAYPLELSGLKTNSTPVLGSTVGLQVSISNKSKRSHQGKIEVVLSDNASSKIIVKEFAALAKIDSSATLSDARISTSDEDNAYRAISIGAKIVQNGVTIGALSNPLSTMIKAKFNDVKGKPAIIVDSNSSSRELLNILSEFGGLKGAGVIDVSLRSENSDVLSKGLSGKSFILVAGGNMADLSQTLLSKSTNSAIITVDGNGRAGDEIEKTALFKGSYAYKASFAGVGALKVRAANKLINKSIASDLVMLEGDLAQVHALLGVSEIFKLSHDGVLKRIASEVSTGNIISPNARVLQLLQGANARMFNEIITANNAYKADVVDSKHIREDKSTLLYKFAKVVDTSSKPSSNEVGLFVAAIDSYETLKAIVNDSSVGRPVAMNVNAYIFGSPLVWNYATESMNKAYKALKKVDSKITGKIRNNARKTSPINIDEVKDPINNNR